MTDEVAKPSVRELATQVAKKALSVALEDLKMPNGTLDEQALDHIGQRLAKDGWRKDATPNSEDSKV